MSNSYKLGTATHQAFFPCLFLFLFLVNGPQSLATTPPPPGIIVVPVTLHCGEDSLQLCANLDNLGGAFNSGFACASPANGSLTVENDTCFFYHPQAGFEGADEACIIVCNDANLCDTFLFQILVEPCDPQYPCADIPYQLLTAFTDDCNGLVKICNPFPLGEALLYDFQVNGTAYSGNLGVCLFDTLYSYSYGSVPGGGANGPYSLDVWQVGGQTFSGTFNSVQELLDLMNAFDPLGDWQFDPATSNVFTFNTSTDYGTMTITQVATNDLIFLSRNSTVAPIGSSIYLPIGVHEVILQHQNNSACRDTFTAVVHCTADRMAFDTILLNQSKTLCLAPNSVPGDLQDVTADCPGCQSIAFFVNGFCVEYQGIAVGTDSLMVEGCDQFGVCHRTLQVVTVRDGSLLPVARTDHDTTAINTPALLDLLSNDDLNGTAKELFIMVPPQHGLAVVGPDFRVTYTPDAGFCGNDSFEYAICNENGCDKATAHILVRCNAPVLVGGFSPNGDGKNDYFVVMNLYDYPQNHLRVFNRWGNLVYEKKDYRNEWDGQALTGDMLPDGTYFYLFETVGQEVVSGFVQVHR